MSTSQDAVNPHHQNHDHYFKDVSNLKHIDISRVLILFGVTDPCLQHAIKKAIEFRSAGKFWNEISKIISVDCGYLARKVREYQNGKTD